MFETPAVASVGDTLRLATATQANDLITLRVMLVPLTRRSLGEITDERPDAGRRPVECSVELTGNVRANSGLRPECAS